MPLSGADWKYCEPVVRAGITSAATKARFRTPRARPDREAGLERYRMRSGS
jgi:hypothetical protein